MKPRLKLPSRRQERGLARGVTAAFTLLEIVIAMALLCMVVLAIYSAWFSIMKGARVAHDAALAAQRTRITMRTVKDSLLCACYFNASPQYYSFFVESQGSDFSALSFVARLPKSFPRSGKYGDFDLRRLTFTTQTGPNGRRQLLLRQVPLLMDMDKDEEQSPLVLADDVATFFIECIDPQTGDWIPDWTYTNQLPREMRITLGLGRLDQYSTQVQVAKVDTVALPAQAVRPEWQIPGGAGAAGGIPNRNNPNPNPNGNGTQPGQYIPNPNVPGQNNIGNFNQPNNSGFRAPGMVNPVIKQ